MNDPTAAVAILETQGLHSSFLILKRASHPDDPWSGHLSFPGGKKDPEDQNLLHTSIRETEEECGLKLSPDQLVKTMPPQLAGQYVGQSILVQPYVFQIEYTESLQLSEEIESFYWLRKSQFIKVEDHNYDEIPIHLKKEKKPFFKLGQDVLWGFTYQVLLNHLKISPKRSY